MTDALLPMELSTLEECDRLLLELRNNIHAAFPRIPQPIASSVKVGPFACEGLAMAGKHLFGDSTLAPQPSVEREKCFEDVFGECPSAPESAVDAWHHRLVGWQAALTTQQPRIEELETLCAEAYVVLGALSEYLPDAKILDNLSQTKLVHKDALPFTAQQAQNIMVKEETYTNLVNFFDKHVGTPCEQIRHREIMEDVQKLVDAAENVALTYSMGWYMDDVIDVLNQQLTPFTQNKGMQCHGEH